MPDAAPGLAVILCILDFSFSLGGKRGKKERE